MSLEESQVQKVRVNSHLEERKEIQDQALQEESRFQVQQEVQQLQEELGSQKKLQMNLQDQAGWQENRNLVLLRLIRLIEGRGESRDDYSIYLFSLSIFFTFIFFWIFYISISVLSLFLSNDDRFLIPITVLSLVSCFNCVRIFRIFRIFIVF